MPALYPLGDRLNFALPDFLRLSWASDHACEVWKPRFKRILSAWAVMERESVLHGLRKCALEKSSSQAGILADASAWHRVVVLKLVPQADEASTAESNQATISSDKVSSHYAIGDSCCVEELRNAWLVQDHHRIGRLLGYPPCCILAFCQRHATGDFGDPIWSIASAGISAQVESPRQIDIKAGAPACNMFWRLLGIRAVPHLPCRLDCEATVALGKSFFDLALRLGFAEEVEWLMQILSWPVEWSALHGIAEIKTPVLKMSTATDATARKLTVRWIGSGYPSEGAQAIRFPYQVPQRLSVTESPAYQRGLAQHSPPTSVLPILKEHTS
jgi:hypothetical protein